MSRNNRDQAPPHTRWDSFQRGKPLTTQRTAYRSLVTNGTGKREAARTVGINYRTAKRWDTQDALTATSTPPVLVISSRYLSEPERIRIADLHRARVSLRAIARELDRSPSTISREIRRNQQPDGYHPHAAHLRAQHRRARPKTSKIAANPQLHHHIQDGLNHKWSPEQIIQRLRRNHPDQPEFHVCHETIYQALYVQGRGAFRRELTTALRTGRAIRTPRRRPDQRRPRMAAPMVMISDRPAEAADRAIPGHWEGDLIIGKNSKSAIGTLVERTTRYVMLLHLPDGYTADRVRDALITTIRTLPTHLRRSLTWDQGSEMHYHHQFSLATDIPVYFCDPHSPWQRGSNENTNGLLRQYFPKSTDLSVHTRERLDTVAAELNARPRKTLGWDSPTERLATLLTAS